MMTTRRGEGIDQGMLPAGPLAGLIVMAAQTSLPPSPLGGATCRVTSTSYRAAARRESQRTDGLR